MSLQFDSVGVEESFSSFNFDGSCHSKQQEYSCGDPELHSQDEFEHNFTQPLSHLLGDNSDYECRLDAEEKVKQVSADLDNHQPEEAQFVELNQDWPNQAMIYCTEQTEVDLLASPDLPEGLKNFIKEADENTKTFIRELILFFGDNQMSRALRSAAFEKFLEYYFGQIPQTLVTKTILSICTQKDKGIGHRRSDALIKKVLTTLKDVIYKPHKQHKAKTKKSQALGMLAKALKLKLDAEGNEPSEVQLWFGDHVKYGLKAQSIKVLYNSKPFFNKVVSEKMVEELLNTLNEATLNDLVTNILTHPEFNVERLAHGSTPVDLKKRSMKLPCTFQENLTAIRLFFQEIKDKAPVQRTRAPGTKENDQQGTLLQKVLNYIDQLISNGVCMCLPAGIPQTSGVKLIPAYFQVVG